MHYAVQVDGKTKINHPSPASAATSARAVDPALDHDHVIRELGEHGVFVLPRHPSIRIVRVA